MLSQFWQTPKSQRWEEVRQTVPYKIFLWDSSGVTRDCMFPHMLRGIFRHEATLRGMHVRSLFPPKVAGVVLKGIQDALRLGRSQKTLVKLKPPARPGYAEIQFFPVQRFVLGLLTYRSLSPSFRILSRSAHQANISSASHGMAGSALTKREREVLLNFRPGLSNRAIAKQLNISERTVKFHFKNIFRKLCIKSRMQLAELTFIKNPIRMKSAYKE